MRENFKIFNELTQINIHIGIINSRGFAVAQFLLISWPWLTYEFTSPKMMYI